MLQGGKVNHNAIDPGGSVLMNLMPLPNQDPSKSAGYNYSSNIINPEHRNQELVRLDYNISDRKSTRLNSSHRTISYAVFCLKKKMIISDFTRCSGVPEI